MEENVKELTSYCGLYCGDCIRYRSRAAELARDLLNECQDTQFGEYAEYKCSSVKQFDPVKQLTHYKECREVLEAIVDLQCNSPCRMGGGCSAFSCGILDCCLKKKLEGCWECEEFENCDNFDPLKACHGERPQKHLSMIKELGLDNWTEYRYKPYMSQQPDSPQS